MQSNLQFVWDVMSKYQQCPGANTNADRHTGKGGPGRKASTEQVFFGSWQCAEGCFLRALVDMMGWPYGLAAELGHGGRAPTPPACFA